MRRTTTIIALFALGACFAPAAALAGAPGPAPRASSITGAYQFLDQMEDLYASGSVPRLVQSYTGGVLAKRHYTDSVTYDDALVIDAYLAAGTPQALSRAETIGNALLYVQANDPAHDGRIRPAYAPTPLLSPADVHATEKTSDVGNMAWVGQALVQLYEASGNGSYLAGAKEIGNWIQANAYDTRGPGGYTGGLTAGGKRIKWKSTEHNIDLYSLFTLLAEATGEPVWSQRAAWALGLVEAMWEPSEGRFYVGTQNDGSTPEGSVQPEDVNSWSYLALRSPAYAASIDWDVSSLAVSARGFAGVSFCRGDRSGVWFEGTAHLADALELRDGPGDEEVADRYLSDIEFAQTNGLNNDGLGIIAASKNKLSTCEGEFYFASLHTGATAWYLLAATHVDPFLPIASQVAVQAPDRPTIALDAERR
ncbi:MAG: hypothetical protein ACLQBB_06400 [Solirubrobacteraceae bacterium]